MAGLMFMVDDWNRQISNSDTPTCTSMPAQWNVPKRQSTEVLRVADLETVKPEYGKIKEPRCFNPMQSMDAEIGEVTIRRITKLREDLAQYHSGNLLLHHVWPIEPDKH